MVKIPVIAAAGSTTDGAGGGSFPGRGRISWGALHPDPESLVHDNFKQLCLKATEQDTLYSSALTGCPGES